MYDNQSIIVKYEYRLDIRSLSIFNRSFESDCWREMNNYIKTNFNENDVYIQFHSVNGWIFNFRHQEDFVKFQLTWC